MSALIPTFITAGLILVAFVLFIILIKSCWKVAGTNEVLIVSGFGKVKTKTGGGIFVIPLVQKTQRMTLENIQVDFTSKNEIPTQDLAVDTDNNEDTAAGVLPRKRLQHHHRRPGRRLGTVAPDRSDRRGKEGAQVRGAETERQAHGLHHGDMQR